MKTTKYLDLIDPKTKQPKKCKRCLEGEMILEMIDGQLYVSCDSCSNSRKVPNTVEE